MSENFLKILISRVSLDFSVEVLQMGCRQLKSVEILNEPIQGKKLWPLKGQKNGFFYLYLNDAQCFKY